ncbi:MAG: heat-inducible transcriptional repressor HrcA [Lachnospiraceae bacterium]|nr:heat-inducible transcriptional repressor HrcA [Lachnospiraceae bacterium]
MQELSERKYKILEAVIRNYLETGEPVGSRTISKYTDLNLSSATIRNEMADLEELGYILQPHTSAGRIPSDKGYRLYVDQMLADKEREVDELKEMLLEKSDQMDRLLEQTAKALATTTEYTAMVSAPKGGNRLKFLQLSRVDSGHLLVVVVSEGNMIKNTIIDLAEELNDEMILKLNILLNTHLNGLAMEEINLAMITAMKQQAGIHSDIIGEVIDAVAAAIKTDEELKIYTSGTHNIFKYPELSDNSKASEIITSLEEKTVLRDLVTETLSVDNDNTGIQVYIGEETPVEGMEDCSVVAATYELEEGMKGTIGIIGPKRMDYDKVIGTVKSMLHQLDDVYHKRN